jgi:carbonic anhydrase/acetyltransferase-like protein (isoleucine patch superfamily)
VNSVSIGERTNVQDNVLIHVARHNPAKAVRTAAGSASTACAPGSGRVQCH